MQGGVLVVSCYELGHQPLAAAWAAAFLSRAGFAASCVDVSVEPWERLEQACRDERPRLVAVSVPMHTALRVGAQAAARIRRAAPDAHLCFFGLYATLNADHLLRATADSVIGGESETALTNLATALGAGRSAATVPGVWVAGQQASPVLEKLSFPVPDRRGLPGLEHYARLEIDGETRPAAAVEASRGCLHLCRHCPIPPVYGGRFFVVPREIVLEDVRRLVRDGVRHVTFADPDFFNGPGHSMALVQAMHEEHPELTFDITTKVEHVLKHRDRLGALARAGCIFVVSAVESLSDVVLGHLRKGHTRQDATRAVALCREAGLALRPSLVAFTPWTSLEDYCEVLDWIDREQLVLHVDPVQFSIRLLVPPGSPLVELEAMLPHLRGLDAAGLTHRWEHPDPRMDRLHAAINALVAAAAREDEPAARTFARIREVAGDAAGAARQPTRFAPALATRRPPRLTEPWFC